MNDRIDPPEGITPPDGMRTFLEISHEASDEAFIDHLDDFIADREWWLSALNGVLRGAGEGGDDCELGRKLRLKIIDIATTAGESQYAVEKWVADYYDRRNSE